MAGQKKKLNYLNLLNDMAYIKRKAKEIGLTDSQLANLKFLRQGEQGNILVDNFSLQLSQYEGIPVIIMLPEA